MVIYKVKYLKTVPLSNCRYLVPVLGNSWASCSNFILLQKTFNWFQWCSITRKPSYRWQTHATRKSAKNCSNSTCLQRCRWRYWPIFIRLAVIASEICEIPRNSLKIQPYGVQGDPRSSILVSMESPYVTSYYSLIVTLAVSATVFEIFTVKDRKLLISPTPSLFEAPNGGTPAECH